MIHYIYYLFIFKIFYEMNFILFYFIFIIVLKFKIKF
jgi:hypothetical protein